MTRTSLPLIIALCATWSIPISLHGQAGGGQGGLAPVDPSILSAEGNRQESVEGTLKRGNVDFGQSTDVNGVFADYVSKMAALRAAYPNVRFVHFTVPLTTGASSDNVVREKFSSLVRNTYRNREPVFDLAQVESTRPDGTTESFSGVRALVAAYSSDGGHLNAVGQQIVATALAQYLATL